MRFLHRHASPRPLPTHCIGCQAGECQPVQCPSPEFSRLAKIGHLCCGSHHRAPVDDARRSGSSVELRFTAARFFPTRHRLQVRLEKEHTASLHKQLAVDTTRETRGRSIIAMVSTFDSVADLCRTRQWKAVVGQVRGDPAIVKHHTSADGAPTLLYIACENGAPLIVVKTILSADSSAALTPCGLKSRLPLHALVASNYQLVDTILTALVEAAPSACRVADRNGSLPIHLLCQKPNISDESIFTTVLSSYPEGAYVKNLAGYYPLQYASENVTATKKTALSALDRGTLYASISKMASLRLASEHDDRIQALTHEHTLMMKKVRSKLTGQIDALKDELAESKKVAHNLEDERKATVSSHREELEIAIKTEKTIASEMENELRSELAGEQLKNMELLEQMEEVQTDLEGKLAFNQSELEAARSKIEEKMKYISSLESCLERSKESIILLIKEQNDMKAAMQSQRDVLAALLGRKETSITEAGALAEKLTHLATEVGVASRETADKTSIVEDDEKEVDQ
ncbi:hypothetical protein THAOC_32743 [Thalassiosira oceanica]|uniref:4Fe-4S ferredoxin-type domain-containing protein n=1 Tax=Thalassiosira oceanica TaxID=159749 RepID=K0R6H2_THAOC|nr:hypothetical protein THAOC_32743 [Thalassiosira oceanica]|eukprot:EJK48455.1 hypothetical protein THAOC_32743 [Thalassiosira oceanica]